MNWKLRLKNKATLSALLAGAAALIYQVLSMAGVTPRVSESAIVELLGLAVNCLCLLGIVVDPTTAGIGDSNRAMAYAEPGVTEVLEEGEQASEEEREELKAQEDEP